MTSKNQEAALPPADDVRELLAKSNRFFQKYGAFGKFLEEFQVEFKQLRFDIVQLLNDKDALEKKNRDAEIRLSSAEEEAKRRLANVEQGHRALVERLSKKEVEIDNMKADLAKREAHLRDERKNLELLKSEYERKLNGLARVEPAVAGKGR